MNGNMVLSQFNCFAEKFAEQNIELVKFYYDYDVFGNYDIIYRLKKAVIRFNNDRNFLSVTIRFEKNQQYDYFKLLAQKLNMVPFDCNSIPLDERLHESIGLISKTLTSVLDVL